MRILLYGGSFNPVHNGHLISAREALEQSEYDKLVFVPANNHPQKSNLIHFKHRFNMLKLCLEDGFEISKIETELSGKNYTINIVDEFRKVGFEKISLLIGMDNLIDIKTWYRWEELVEKTDFFVLRRIGYELPLNLDSRIKYKVLNTSSYQLSSTRIRERIKLGLSVKYMIPDVVEKYINQNKLYNED